MVSLGRYPLGGTVHLYLVCTDGARAPALPDNAPRLAVFDSSGNRVLTKQIAIQDRYQVTGLFHHPLFLGAPFGTGHYGVELSYSISGAPFLETAAFDVTGDGNVEGDTLAMYFFRRPHADFVVWQTESGKIKKGRNPYL